MARNAPASLSSRSGAILTLAITFAVAIPGVAPAAQDGATAVATVVQADAAAIVQATTPTGVSPTQIAGTQVWVTAAELGLRSGPSNQHPVTVTGLARASAVTTGNSDGGWIQVIVGGVRVWTPARFLSETEPAWNPRRVTVAAASLELRSGPLGTYPVTVAASRGTAGIFTGVIRNQWWQVKIGNRFAWTPSRFLAGADSPVVTPAPSSNNVWVTARELGLRSGPSGSYPVTVTAYEDARAVTTGSAEDGWAQVRIGGATAWTPERFLTTTQPAWNPIRVTVNAQSLGLRSGPLGTYPVTVTASRGTSGIFSGVERNGWWEVKIGATFAWTPARFVSVGNLYDVSAVMRIAHAEVGYREPAWRTNKYNTWINGNNPWCGVFVAWVFDRAGYPEGVPKTKHFDDFVSQLRDSGVLNTTVRGSDLRAGDVVLIDWPPRDGPTHTGIVDRVEGSSVWLVEGNTTSGTGDSTRGVFHRKRNLVDVVAWFRPSEYALATR